MSRHGLLIAACSLASGCLSEAPADPCDHPPEPSAIDEAAPRRAYVVNHIRLPDGASEAQQLGLNLDDDPQGRPDNALGQLLSMVFSWTGTDHNDITSRFVADGTLIHVIDMQTSGLQHATSVGASVVVARDRDRSALDNFSGQETFDVDSMFVSSPMSGVIADGELDVRMGELALQIALPGLDEPFTLHLIAARLDGTIDEQGIDAILAGAVTRERFETELLPIAHAAIERIVGNDCPAGVCEPGSNGERFVKLLDEDNDGDVSFGELRDNDLVASLFAPDVDLYDADGALNPRCDEEKDSLSIGVRITAVPARLAR